MKLSIKGAIINNDDKWLYDLLEMESTAPKDIINAIDGQVEDLDIIINSGGGDVYSGSEIYTALKEYPGKVNVKVVGIAASAASLIAMSGDHVSISPTAQLMIHNVSTIVAGDNRTLEHEAEVLRGFNQSIASAYISKTGKDEAEILDMMNKETWLTATDSVEQGFADSILFADNTLKVAADAGTLLSNEVVTRLKNMMDISQSPTVEIDYDLLAEKVQGRLNEQKQNTEHKDESHKPKNNGLSRFIF